MRPWQGQLNTLRSWANWGLQEATSAAFIVALMTPYTRVVHQMLDALPRSSVDMNVYNFGKPLDIVLAIGRKEQAELLLSHGAELRNSAWSSTCRALVSAAKKGHADVIEWALQNMPDPECNHALYARGVIAENAAAHQQWHIVTQLLGRDAGHWPRSTMEQYLNSVLCWAARYGQIDVVSNGIHLRDASFTSRRFPLGQAALGGHLDMCRLLVEKGIVPRGYELNERSEALVQAVAKGGNMEVCKFLRQHEFWKPWHEIHFLPIAAEMGHLEFAKFAVANGCDTDSKKRHSAREFTRNPLRRIRYPEDIRCFALYRAIVSGHLDVVRWLVYDIGVPVHRRPGDEQLDLVPMDLAIGAGRIEMVALLAEMHAGPGRDWSDGLERYNWKEEVIECMSYYRDALCLRADYDKGRVHGLDLNNSQYLEQVAALLDGKVTPHHE